jgi:hypothetical protein
VKLPNSRDARARQTLSATRFYYPVRTKFLLLSAQFLLSPCSNVRRSARVMQKGVALATYSNVNLSLETAIYRSGHDLGQRFECKMKESR